MWCQGKHSGIQAIEITTYRDFHWSSWAKRIAGLYAVEQQARGQPPEKRGQLRQAHARSILDALEARLEAQLPRISGKSELAKAIRYAPSRLKKLRPIATTATSKPTTTAPSGR